MEEWQSAGVILYTAANHVPRLKIITKEHTYEIQSHKFHPIMRVFAVLVDGEFRASIHDSIDRFLKLDEVSKSGKCSEREQQLSSEINVLQKRIHDLEVEKQQLQVKYNDARVIIFDGV
jgi:predicted ribosome quality control (RQC) complex YloA/Tae2 family protein